MELELSINGVMEDLEITTNESLLTLLRREGYSSVKHGCETGECGACTVLVDGVPRLSCVMLAAQAGGCSLTTVENMGSSHKLHPLQEAFKNIGAVQCGYCIPGMLLSAAALLKRNADPTEDEVRDALSGHLCRCTGYVKPVQAIIQAAAVMRGEKVASVEYEAADQLQVVGKPVPDIDAVKLVTGKPTFATDVTPRGMLYGRILTSPHAHAIIRNIDVSYAKAMPGVYAVLTHKDVPRVPYSSVACGLTEVGLRDQYCLDSMVRYVGDRVAVVAAETPEVAEQAIKLIQVDYDVLPAILDPRQALEQGAPCLHPEEESCGIFDASRNLAAHIRTEVGDVERGLAEADEIIEGEYLVPLLQSTPIENHAVVTYFDENDYLVVRTCTDAPHHIRRTLASVLGLPARCIRVVKPRVGGSFGVKQQIVLEDLCALLTVMTNRPVMLAYSRVEEFQSSRIHQQYILRLKTGVQRDGTIVAHQLMLLTSTGAHGTHPLIVSGDVASSTLQLYPCPNTRFMAEVLYTNHPPSGAFRGYGVPQEFFALECHMDEIAKQLGMDVLTLRRKNWIKAGNEYPWIKDLGKNRTSVESCGLPECLQIVTEKLRWYEKRGRVSNGHIRRGVGIALALHRNPVASTSASGAMLKLNEDGSFDLFASAHQSGNGSETMLVQIAAEVLGVSIENILLHSTETALIPFEIGASGSAVLYASGGAVKKAAEQVRRQMLAVGGRILNALPETLKIKSGIITAPNGQTVTIPEVAAQSFSIENRHIMTTASWKDQCVPTSFAAQGVEVEVDTETGSVRVLKAVTAVDVGHAINPMIVEGQIQGSVAQALGLGMCEEMIYDQKGVPLTTNLSDYRLLSAPDMPEMPISLVQTHDTAGPFGAKAVAEIALNGIAPAIANAIADALGVRIRQIPFTPERVLRALHAHAQTTRR